MKRLLTTLAVSLLVSSPALADKYTFDKSHTKILFFVNHLGYADSIGEFPEYDGFFTFDEKAPEKSTVDVTIKPAGVRTSSKLLDEHLQGEQWFNTAKFPDVKFVSTEVKATGPNTGEVTGNLTLLGVTKPVTMMVKFNKADYHPFSKEFVAGFSGAVMVKRSDFGMKAYVPDVGDEVRLMIQVEGINADRKKQESIKKD